jgi:DNA gyrase subunit A
MGKAIKFHEDDVRPMGRSAVGVKGISLQSGDNVVGGTSVIEGSVLTVTEKGYVKRTSFSEYPLQKRGGKGVITMKVTHRNGPVADMRAVSVIDEVLIISQQGKLIRTPVKEIREMGRATQGVIGMTLEADDLVSAVTVVERD